MRLQTREAAEVIAAHEATIDSFVA
eukprot:SAG31_NODE_28671_length_406_cov_1.560261_2_plen_24_part_01